MTAAALARAVRWDFDAIGTRWAIDTPAPLGPEVRAAVRREVDRFDAFWSRFRSDSVVSMLGRSGGRVPAPAEAEEMFALYDALDTATGGAVNPLVGDSLERLGYDARYSLQPGEAVPAPRGWRELTGIEEGELRIPASRTLDVGALGKGALVDLVQGVLRAHEAHRGAVIDASGDLIVDGGPERVGLEHPYDPTRAIGVWEVSDAALCASATNRRAWGYNLHHVLDARTGVPVRTIAATWAVAPTAMLADAAATALFFDGGPEFAAARAVQWVRMTTDGRVEWSPGCDAEVFTR